VMLSVVGIPNSRFQNNRYQLPSVARAFSASILN
jgi:hypothetical protein